MTTHGCKEDPNNLCSTYLLLEYCEYSSMQLLSTQYKYTTTGVMFVYRQMYISAPVQVHVSSIRDLGVSIFCSCRSTVEGSIIQQVQQV